jgi:ADP-ribose pyrophosphatase YjhB (NUDIX family)
MDAISGGRFRIGVFAIVHRDGEVLLARRRDSGWWNLPGGGLELGETVDEGIVREVREETGLQVAVERLVGVYSKPQGGEVVLLFACTILGGELRPTDESSEYCWVAPTAPPPKTLPKHVERLADWALREQAAVIRSQRAPSLRSSGGYGT